MKYLKTYEGLFDFFKKKPKKVEVDNTDFFKSHEEDIKDCFIEISQDKNLNIYTKVHSDHILLTMNNRNANSFIELDNNMIESFEFANSYLLDFGLKIFQYTLCIYGYYNNVNWLGDIYFDDINDLRYLLKDEESEEACKKIEDVYLIIKRV